jgi:hypothetical protein
MRNRAMNLLPCAQTLTLTQQKSLHRCAARRATIALPQINDPDMVAIRQLLATLGLLAEIHGAES